MRKTFSQEAKQEACRRYLAGEGSGQIARDYGTKIPTVCKWLGAAGIPRRQQTGVPKALHAELVQRYTAGESSSELAASYGVHQTTVLLVLEKQGVSRRNVRICHGGVPLEQHGEIARRYVAGENIVQLSKAYGVSFASICRYLDEQGVERRQSGGCADTVQQAITGTRRFSHKRDTELYVVEMESHRLTHSKVGIAFDSDHRRECSAGKYGEEHLRMVFETRQEAFFLEQAVLEATKYDFDPPQCMAGWVGVTEIRAVPANRLSALTAELASEMEELGHWEFAALRVPMTADQRAACLAKAA
jgi:transposase-like protein